MNRMNDKIGEITASVISMVEKHADDKYTNEIISEYVEQGGDPKKQYALLVMAVIKVCIGKAIDDIYSEHQTKK